MSAPGVRCGLGGASEDQAGAGHDDAQSKVQPVIGRVKGHEVGRAVLVDDQAVDLQHEVDDTADDQVEPRRPPGASRS